MAITRTAAGLFTAMLLATQALAQGGPPAGTGGGNLAARVAALEEQVSLQTGRIADLETQMTALQTQVALMEAFLAVVVVEDVGTDLNGDGIIEDIPVDLDGDGVPDAASEFLPTVRFEGVNVQIVNDHSSQSTISLNALGNLIVGYNEPRLAPGVSAVCSAGEFTNQVDCEVNGHVWAVSHKSGSHNLVVGPANAYSRAGGAVFGELNVVSRRGASVTGGRLNAASNDFATVSGGSGNTASGALSSVSGGNNNRASAAISSVSGGSGNAAAGVFSNVSGGEGNTARAAGSSVSGGAENTAGGVFSSVSGGLQRTTPGANNWAAGALLEPN